MSHIFSNKGHRWIGGLTTAGLIVLASGAVASADEQIFTAPEDARVLWIDVEGKDIDRAQVLGVISSETNETPLEFHRSPSGLTATVEDFPQTFAVELNADTQISARLAVTFATAEQTILSESGSHTVISGADESTPNGPNTPDPEQTDPEHKPDGTPDNSGDGTDTSTDTSDPKSEGTPNSTDDGTEKEKDSKKSSDSEAKDPGIPAVTGASVLWTVGVAVALLAIGLGTMAIRRRGAQIND